MKQFITALIHHWSPWHLRRRVAKLEHDLDHLTERRDDFISEANRHNVKENERLTKENTQLFAHRRAVRIVINNELAEMGLIINDLQDVKRRFENVCMSCYLDDPKDEEPTTGDQQ